jgi:hypothetical protein
LNDIGPEGLEGSSPFVDVPTPFDECIPVVLLVF